MSVTTNVILGVRKRNSSDGKSILSRITALINDITADKLISELEILKHGSNILTE